jgi:molecular chaperone DnaK (HSP70)
MTKDCSLLGQFEFTGIPPAPRGVPQLEITYDIDANGILNVSASDKSSGKKQNLVITNDKSRHSKEQIEEMIKAAEKLKDEDDKQLKRIEARNSLESYTYNWRNQMDNKEITEKMESTDVETIKSTVKSVQEWLESNLTATTEEYQEKLKETEGVLNPIITKLYSQASGDMPQQQQQQQQQQQHQQQYSTSGDEVD